MLPTLIQRYVKIISFQEREINWNFTGRQMPYFMIILKLYINLLNLSWIIKCLFLRNMEPLRGLDGRFSAIFLQGRQLFWFPIYFLAHQAPSEKLVWSGSIVSTTHPTVSLRKHAYLNILKILPSKNEKNQIKKSDILRISAQNIDCGIR